MKTIKKTLKKYWSATKKQARKAWGAFVASAAWASGHTRRLISGEALDYRKAGIAAAAVVALAGSVYAGHRYVNAPPPVPMATQASVDDLKITIAYLERKVIEHQTAVNVLHERLVALEVKPAKPEPPKSAKKKKKPSVS